MNVLLFEHGVLRRAMRDEFWGLLGRPVRPGSYAQAARAMLQGATLEHALLIGLAHYRLHIDDFVARLQVSQGTASLRLFSRAPVTESQAGPSCRRTEGMPIRLRPSR